MIFIDANVFLAYDNTRDLLHKRAVKLWLQIEAGDFGECFTSDYVLNEVVGVTYRKLGKKRAVILGDRVQKSIPILNIDANILKKAWILFTKTTSKLNLVDCTNVIALQTFKANTLATFDKEFSKMKIEIVN